MVEITALEKRHARKGIGGSNPPASARRGGFGSRSEVAKSSTLTTSNERGRVEGFFAIKQKEPMTKSQLQ